MKKRFLLGVGLIVASLLVGCSTESKIETENSEVEIKSEAKGDDIKINAKVVNGNKINLDEYSENIEINNGGSYDINGSFSGVIVISAKDEVNINLSNVNITNEDGPCIYIKNSENVNFNISGENTLNVKSNTTYNTLDAAIYSKSDIEFSGDGVLNIETLFGDGIKGKDTIIFNSGTYNINSKVDCINANEDLIIHDGIYVLTSGEDECIQSDTNIVINDMDGTFNTAGDAIKAEVLVQIEDGNINIETANEGIESKDAIIINNGEIVINSTDDCINATNSILINNGNIYAVSSTNDAIDSNGTLEINDGIIYGAGINTPETAFDCDQKNIVINGGTILGFGSMDMKSEGQNAATVTLQNITEIKNIKITDSNGNVIIENEFNLETTSFAQMQDFENKNDFDKNERPGGENMDNSQDFGQQDSNQQAPPEKPDGNFNIEEMPEQGKDMNRSNNMNPSFDKTQHIKNGLLLFLSSNKFDTNETYSIYINDSLVDTFTI